MKSFILLAAVTLAAVPCTLSAQAPTRKAAPAETLDLTAELYSRQSSKVALQWAELTARADKMSSEPEVNRNSPAYARRWVELNEEVFRLRNEIEKWRGTVDRQFVCPPNPTDKALDEYRRLYSIELAAKAAAKVQEEADRQRALQEEQAEQARRAAIAQQQSNQRLLQEVQAQRAEIRELREQVENAGPSYDELRKTSFNQMVMQGELDSIRRQTEQLNSYLRFRR